MPNSICLMYKFVLTDVMQSMWRRLLKASTRNPNVYVMYNKTNTQTEIIDTGSCIIMIYIDDTWILETL